MVNLYKVSDLTALQEILSEQTEGSLVEFEGSVATVIGGKLQHTMRGNIRMLYESSATNGTIRKDFYSFSMPLSYSTATVLGNTWELETDAEKLTSPRGYPHFDGHPFLYRREGTNLTDFDSQIRLYTLVPPKDLVS